MKKILKFRGIIENSPRAILRASANDGLIDKLDEWFEFLEFRNSTSNSYNLKIADEICSNLPRFKILLNDFFVNIKDM